MSLGALDTSPDAGESTRSQELPAEDLILEAVCIQRLRAFASSGIRWALAVPAHEAWSDLTPVSHQERSKKTKFPHQVGNRK